MRFWGLDYALRNMGITGGFGDRIRVCDGFSSKKLQNIGPTSWIARLRVFHLLVRRWDRGLLVRRLWFLDCWKILGSNGDHRQTEPTLERDQFSDVIAFDAVADPLEEVSTTKASQRIRPGDEGQQDQTRQGQGDADQMQREVDGMLVPQAPLACRRTTPAEEASSNRKVIGHDTVLSGQQVHRCKSQVCSNRYGEVTGMESLSRGSAGGSVFRSGPVYPAWGAHFEVAWQRGTGMSHGHTSLGVKIAPSILSADFARLGEQVRAVEAAGADRIHVDVMDGHFVPNLSMGAVVVRSLRPITRLPLEVHLMVEEPGRFLDGFVAAGADTLIVHLEVLPDPRPLLEHIRRGLGKRCGLAINPDMPVTRLQPYLRDIDVALCMTVFPGFGGQAYIPASTQRIAELRRLIAAEQAQCELEVDGGIEERTIGEAARAGADVFVAGTAIFSHPEGPAAAVLRLACRAREAMAPQK
jgi:ribulose-phosphate 3-epimerase